MPFNLFQKKESSSPKPDRKFTLPGFGEKAPIDPLVTMEKKILKEGKVDDTTVRHELADLARLEKESQKARKDLEKAQALLAKREKEEHQATTNLNNATHAHEVSVVKLSDAQKDLKIKQEWEEKMHADLTVKRAAVDNVVNEQKERNEERESKLSGIRREKTVRTTKREQEASGTIEPEESNEAPKKSIETAPPTYDKHDPDAEIVEAATKGKGKEAAIAEPETDVVMGEPAKEEPVAAAST
ncbi:hypothetical protein CYLTODRAFT_486914 [Cylindrobasidium torrendii FP15055 ss-10]|uniref:Uncharacterized protein n=1 Tax=Cylindrobasidium torrendii FP15055 ss-10 TaxID=1314674 RepID=A0A0D7BNP5_9AGAR|nr:hypothetical protein CYLTODRAFT_486914 [Cylindrobasidium torrendii FP15055 ss-10]